MLFDRPETSNSACFRGGIYILMQYMFPGPTGLSIPNYISIGSAVFAHLTADSPYA